MGQQLGLQDQLQLPVSVFTTFGPSRAIYLYFKHQKWTQLASSCVVCWVLYCHFYYLEDTRMPKTEGSVKENPRKARKKGGKKGSRPSMTSEDKQLRIDFSGAGDSLGPQA